MNKLLRIKLILNKKNKSASIQVPKKNFDLNIRKKIDNAKWAFVKFEGFE